MERQITQQEIAAYKAFAAENRIVIEGEVGEKNANVLAAYLDGQMNGAVVNKENLSKAFVAVCSQLTLIDPREVEYTRVFNSLSKGEQAVFTNWWKSTTQSKRLITTGLEGAENAAIILGWMKARRYQIASFESLDQAIQNVISQPGRKLTLVSTPSVEFTPGRHSGKTFSDSKKEDEDRTFVNGRKNHSLDPKIVEQSVSPKTIEAEFQMKAEALIGKTHGQTQMCRRLFEKNQDGSINWANTYASRCRYLERNGERTM